ncbi:MAG: UDP-N-acetylmuramoyl-tripeptide--D-alanyl-D-alanine ligase, partial [Patescibacteria group bacterium]
MKKIVQKILYVLARRVLKKYKPDIIGITGSMGKTSTKEAIFAVLSSKFRARQNLKNYNNE